MLYTIQTGFSGQQILSNVTKTDLIVIYIIPRTPGHNLLYQVKQSEFLIGTLLKKFAFSDIQQTCNF